MAASIDISAGWFKQAWPVSWLPLDRLLVFLLSGSLLLAALLLVIRRLTGALLAPLPPLAFIGVGLSGASAALVAEVLARQSLGADQRKTTIAAAWVTRLSLPAIALAISLPGSSLVGLTSLWLMVVGSELILWRWRRTVMPDSFRQRSRPGGLRDSALTESPRIQQHFGGGETEPLSRFTTSVAEPLPLDALPLDQEKHDSTQQIMYRSVAGKLIVEGWFRAGFSAGQRVAVAHIAFCPAFERVPQVDAESTSDIDCSVQAGLVLPWGVRWEVKLASPAETPASVTIEFIAQET